MARTATWKAAERAVAALLGGERIPVTGRERGSAPDVAHGTLSLEVKHRATIPAWIHDAMDQAEKANGGERCPVVILHEHGQVYRESFALMRVRDLVELLEG